MEKNMNKHHLATITILVKDRHAQAPDVNKILTAHGNMIIARLGVNVQKHCFEHCTAMITIVVEETVKEINALTEKLDEIYGIVAKASIMTE